MADVRILQTERGCTNGFSIHRICTFSFRTEKWQDGVLYQIVPDMTLRTTIIWNVIRIFFQIFLFHMRNEWMILTETLLYICHTFYVLRPMFTVFLVWHPLECERDDSIGGGKSMWKRKGFENVEMASIHHDEDSPIHNIWSLHWGCCCTVDPHISHTQFPTFCERAAKTVPLQQLLTQASQ